MIRFLIIGAGGQLGRAIHDYCEELDNQNLKLYETDVVPGYVYLDATDKLILENFIDDNNIDIVVNCAAYTNVGNAEKDFDNCYKLNTKLVETINDAILSSANNPYLFHISTDYVYSGNGHKPYKESEAGNPSGIYGFTKLEGEKKISTDAIVFRTSWLYYDGKASFVSKIQKQLKYKDEIKVVIDQIGSPTYAYDLAKTIIDISLDHFDDLDIYSGIYNYSNLGVCSWYDFAKAIEKATIKINKVIPFEYEDKIRPAYSVMSKSKFINTFPEINIPHWKDSLDSFLMKQYFKARNLI